jgi:hypothetical protein
MGRPSDHTAFGLMWYVTRWGGPTSNMGGPANRTFGT